MIRKKRMKSKIFLKIWNDVDTEKFFNLWFIFFLLIFTSGKNRRGGSVVDCSPCMPEIGVRFPAATDQSR